MPGVRVVLSVISATSMDITNLMYLFLLEIEALPPTIPPVMVFKLLLASRSWFSPLPLFLVDLREVSRRADDRLCDFLGGVHHFLFIVCMLLVVTLF